MLSEFLYKKFVEWLEEDAPFGDLTSRIIEDKCYKAIILAKDWGVVAGLDLIRDVLARFGLGVITNKKDGNSFKKGDVLAVISGSIKKILLLERTILNFLARMCGVARYTRQIVELAKKENPRIIVAATRKTTPGLRIFEKYAVEVGGGRAHRFSLSDMILIKDNHIRVVGSVEEAVKRAKTLMDFPHKIEVEVSNVEDAIRAAELGADIIMLDNMPPEKIKVVIEELERRGLRNKVLLEASGGININNVMYYSRSGVDIISMGVLTHSYKSCDISLEVVEEC